MSGCRALVGEKEKHGTFGPHGSCGTKQAQAQQLQEEVSKGNARVLELQRTADTLQGRINAGEEAVQTATEAAQVGLSPDYNRHRDVRGYCMVCNSRRRMKLQFTSSCLQDRHANLLIEVCCCEGLAGSRSGRCTMQSHI